MIITIDTCRADHLSLYGYERETSPFLEKLARDGVVFEDAFTQATDTTPSHASLFTSRYPFRHGAANGVPLRDEFTTLAEIFQGAGYRTAAFVSGWTMTARESGLSQGFEVYDDTLNHAGMPAVRRGPTERQAGQTADRVLEWLDDHAEEAFFLFVHFFDPHGRYAPPPPYDTMFPPSGLGRQKLPLDRIPAYTRLGDETDVAVFVSRYDGEIRYVDDQISRIVGDLEARGLRDDTLLVVTADHGESLTEHDSIFSHGWLLFDPSIHVPLLISYPPSLPQGRRVRGIVETIDVMPTLLDLAGWARPEALDGISLLPVIAGDPGPRNRYTVSKTTKVPTYLQLGLERDVHDQYAVRTEDWKYIHSEDGSSHMLFDLKRDPEENRDLSTEDLLHLDRMKKLLTQVLDDSDVDTSRFLETLDEEERLRREEQLRSLGYIH